VTVGSEADACRLKLLIEGETSMGRQSAQDDDAHKPKVEGRIIESGSAVDPN